MITIDTYIFAAICCEAAFGLIVTLCMLKALVSVLIHGWGDEEKPETSGGLKPARDTRLDPK